MRIFYVLLMILVGGIAFSQEKIQYFDQNWKTTTKDKAKFYRPLPLKKLGTLELLQDYFYPSGKLQFQGYIANGEEHNSMGDAIWFYEDGTQHSAESFINKTAQKKLSYYFDDGKIWKTIEYGDSLKNGKTIEYKPDGSILGEAFYVNGTLVSGTVGQFYGGSDYARYKPKTKQSEFVSTPQYTGAKGFTRKYYYH